MTVTARTGTTRMAALDLSNAPVAPFTLGAPKTSKNLSGGKAIAIPVFQGTRRLGYLHDPDDGSAPRFESTDPAGNDVWATYVEQWRGKQFQMSETTVDGKPFLYGSFEEDGSPNSEDVVTLLVENAMLLKTLKGKGHNGLCVLVGDVFPADSYTFFKGVTDDAHVRGMLHTRYPSKRLRVWNNASFEWVTI